MGLLWGCFIEVFLRYVSLYKTILSLRYCPLMVNKFKSNILSPIPSTDQERTLTFWHSPAIRTHAHSTWTNRNSLIKTLNLEWAVLWNHKEESAPRTRQECHIGVVRKDSRGLPAATEPFITSFLAVAPQPFPKMSCIILPAACPFP